MRKTLMGLFALLFLTHQLYAQSKVFKEVGNEISTQVSTIIQDGALVGYVAFTKLEKASEDSFNYRITIMDENLNDIGVVNFKAGNLALHAVSFEQDVICLAYLQQRVAGKVFKKLADAENAMQASKPSILLQFLGLDGKILKTESSGIALTLWNDWNSFGGKWVISGELPNPIQVSNIPNFGFACFYGDSERKHLKIYKPNGEKAWTKEVKLEPSTVSMLTTAEGIYLLSQKKQAVQVELHSYSVLDSTYYPGIKLTDKKGHTLQVLTFSKDPSTGMPYVAGTLLNNSIKWKGTANQLFKGPFAGTFSTSVNGHKSNDIKTVTSYWDDGSQNMINQKGYIAEKKAYVQLFQSFRDFQGNTFFVGPSAHKKLRWEPLACAPLVLPLFMFAADPNKVKVGDPLLIKQQPNGSLSLDNSIPVTQMRPMVASVNTVSGLSLASYYSIADQSRQTNYLIVDDTKTINFYNVTTKKSTRTIPSKEGNTRIAVFPAKEGYVMIAEYNKKEKYTRVSIEAL